MESRNKSKPSTAVLAFEAVGKTYAVAGGDPRQVLRDVSFSVPAGRRIAIVGRSGSGKSTLLHLAAGIDVPSHGDVRVMDRSMAVMSETERTILRRDHVGLVFQFFYLMPHLSVHDNVALPALIAGDRASVDHYRHWRLINVCQSAAMAIETSLKSLAALTGEPVRRAHDIDYLLTRTGPHTGAARAALEPLATPQPDTEGNLYHHVTIWRAAGAYLADHPEIDLAATTRLAPGLATAAAQIVTTAAAQIAHTVEDPTAVQPAQQVIAAVTAALNNRNLIEGQPHGRTITPTDHGPAIT